MPAAITQQHVLVMGGGLVGLTIAQGLKKRGIACTVFERDPDQGRRSQGWAITIHWILGALGQMLPKELFDKLDTVQVDPFLRQDEGNFLFLDGRDLSIVYRIPPSKRRVRAHRGKLRELLLTGLTVQYEKRVARFETITGGVRAWFTDGSSAEGTVIVGADGNNSVVRKQLVGEEAAALNSIPVVSYGVVQRYTKEQVAPLRALDPLLFQAVNPETRSFVWHSIQEIDETQTHFDLLTMVSHQVTDPALELPHDASDEEKIADMKKHAEGFAEPLYSLVRNIDPSLKCTRISLADWVPMPWDNKGRVTLAGDATGPMTMYRGEGANHGLLDAACFVSQMCRVSKGEISLPEALDKYEEEVRARREIAIPLSRQAALDAHSGIPGSDSPIVTGRAGPPIAFGTFA